MYECLSISILFVPLILCKILHNVKKFGFWKAFLSLHMKENCKKKTGKVFLKFQNGQK
jgi:hypothetical protein